MRKMLWSILTIDNPSARSETIKARGRYTLSAIRRVTQRHVTWEKYKIESPPQSYKKSEMSRISVIDECLLGH